MRDKFRTVTRIVGEDKRAWSQTLAHDLPETFDLVLLDQGMKALEQHYKTMREGAEAH